MNDDKSTEEKDGKEVPRLVPVLVQIRTTNKVRKLSVDDSDNDASVNWNDNDSNSSSSSRGSGKIDDGLETGEVCCLLASNF